MATIYDPQDEKKDTQGTQGQTQGLQTIGTASPQGTNTTTQRPQGSGRFTNLQKYLQANQGAGQRIAGQVGDRLGSGLQKQQEQAQSYNQKLGQAVSQAQQGAQQGAGYLEQLRTMGTQLQQPEGATATQAASQALGAQQFAQSPQFSQYQAFQQGRGVDEALLAQRQQAAQQGAQALLTGAQQAQQQLGSEGGRFNLLRQTFGGAARPDYTTGQQRLDQLFLTGGGGLGQVQQDVSGRVKAAQDLARQAGLARQDVSGLTTQEQQLMGDIQQQAMSNVGSYENLLRQQMEERKAEAATLGPQLQEQLGKDYLTPEQAATLGVSDLAGTNLLDLDLLHGGYLSSQMRTPTVAGTTTGEQAQRYSALRNILGQQEGGLFSPDTEVGTYTPYEFDRERLEKDISGRMEDFRKQTGAESPEDFMSSNFISQNVLPSGIKAPQPQMGGGMSSVGSGQMSTWDKTLLEVTGGDMSKMSPEVLQRVVNLFEQRVNPTALSHIQGGTSDYNKAQRYLNMYDKFNPGRTFGTREITEGELKSQIDPTSIGNTSQIKK